MICCLSCGCDAQTRPTASRTQICSRWLARIIKADRAEVGALGSSKRSRAVALAGGFRAGLEARNRSASLRRCRHPRKSAWALAASASASASTSRLRLLFHAECFGGSVVSTASGGPLCRTWSSRPRSSRVDGGSSYQGGPSSHISGALDTSPSSSSSFSSSSSSFSFSSLHSYVLFLLEYLPGGRRPEGTSSRRSCNASRGTCRCGRRRCARNGYMSACAVCVSVEFKRPCQKNQRP